MKSFLTILCMVLFASCVSVEKKSQSPKNTHKQAIALFSRVRSILPEGWEATLYWSPEDPGYKPTPLPVDWLGEGWQSWLPGTDGRRIEVRRKKAVDFWVDWEGPNPHAHYKRKETEYLRFALMLGDAPKGEDVSGRLSELNNKIKQLEDILKLSFSWREKDGYARYSVPADDEGRRAAREYDRLWTIKRLFPQWSEGDLSVGFYSMTWLRMLPEDAKDEYRQVKEKVLSVLRPIEGWKYVPSNEE